jgi:hypothetical protein
MSAPSISDSVRSYLNAYFKGSTIEDGYYFVSVRAPICWRIHDSAVQQVGDRIAESGSWVIAVGVDPTRYVNASTVEQRTVIYNPDWNIEKELPQWVVELGRAGIDLRSLLEEETVPGAAAIINPQRGIILDANMRRLYANDEATLAALLAGMEYAVAERSS